MLGETLDFVVTHGLKKGGKDVNFCLDIIKQYKEDISSVARKLMAAKIDYYISEGLLANQRENIKKWQEAVRLLDP